MDSELIYPLWEKNRKRDSKHDELIKSIFNLIELKDTKTASHCRAVAYYCDNLSYALDMSDSERTVLHEGAMLHDIGKLYVDKAVLNKGEPLEPHERLMIESHAEMGLRVLEGFHLDDRIVDIAWHHHERFDGSGYPDGRKEEQISYYTRIVSVADTVDAMSTNRPYKSKMKKSEVIEELYKCMGTQLDPEITETIIRLLNTGKVVLMG